MALAGRRCLLLLAFAVGSWAVAGTPVQAGEMLNVDRLRESIAERTRVSWGEKDERFRQFSKEQVRVVQQVPVEVKGGALFAVKVKLVMPPPDTHEEQLLLVVDASGQLQFADIQNLATGASLLEEPMAILKHIEKIPDNFGKMLFSGKGAHEVVVVSDPFCPYCRKGWAFLKEQRQKIKTLRLAHFPLNRISEVACMAVLDAEVRNFNVLEMVDFAYGHLNFAEEPSAILEQFMARFPELKKYWGENGSAALAFLESRYLEKVRKERMDAQGLGITSTPVFFMDGHMIEGFQAEKLGERLQ